MTITSAELIDDEDMTEKFHVVYDGSALDEHLMDVRDLAPAMMAISDLLIHANQECAVPVFPKSLRVLFGWITMKY